MIVGILLAAGKSTRMGRPKLTLSWKDGRTVVGQVVHVLLAGGVDRIVVVTGADREAVWRAADRMGVTFVHNEGHASAEMFSSIKLGLRSLESTEVEAAMITPGDLPAIRPGTITALIQEWRERPAQIVVPSHEGRRGHPVLVARTVWPRILALPDQSTLRDFLLQESASVRHVVVDDPGVVRDLDTPNDYQRAQGDDA